MASELPELIGRYLAAINDEDWDTVASVFSDDAEVRALGAPVARGGVAVAAHFREVLTPLPEHHDEPTRVVTGGDLVVVEMTVSGRTADGRPIAFDAVDVIELAPGGTAIARLDTWFDTAATTALLRG